MGMVLPLYSPWRVVEEVAMLDHLTEGRLEIGCANGVPQELKRIGIDSEEARDRFNESLEILDAALIKPVISHHGKYWNFDDLAILPRPRQQPSPPKWTTVVSKKSAKKTAERNSKICTGFQSVELITEIFDVYRNEADWNQFVAGPDHIGLRRNVSVAEDESEAKEGARVALEATLKLVADDPRVGIDATSIIDNPTGGSGFSLHEDEFISGTPDQVAEQIILQCRACGAGHFLATIGRASRLRRAKLISMFGKEVVPKLRQADIIQ
jgi:alkanesulfonate monooxygenase SsuD/methylene tetrahydromethanopterin reductase-like flavin-dependent oxidoreductase (luciferase family)